MFELLVAAADWCCMHPWSQLLPFVVLISACVVYSLLADRFKA